MRNVYRGGSRPFTMEILKNRLKELELPYGCASEEYVNARTKLDFRCLKCGEIFKATPDNILRGHGCPFCAGQVPPTKEEIRRKISGRYTVKSLEFKKCRDKIILTCEKHGDFSIPVRRVMQGHGCPRCGLCSGQDYKRKTTEQFLEEISFRNYDEIYDFSETVYVNAKTRITVICRKCGKRFEKNPRLFYSGTMKACPCCSYYAGEEIIKDLLEENKIAYIPQYSFKGSEISRLSFDFYLPAFNTVVEFQGMQHYKAVRCWGGEERLKRQQENDQRKRDYCAKNGIREIEISYRDSPLTALRKNGIIP